MTNEIIFYERCIVYINTHKVNPVCPYYIDGDYKTCLKDDRLPFICGMNERNNCDYDNCTFNQKPIQEILAIKQVHEMVKNNMRE